MPASLTAMPPGVGFFSITATFLPKYAACVAALPPAGPEPSTTMSHRSLMRQHHAERRPHALLRDEAELAAHFADQLARDVEAQAEPLLAFGGEERLEDLLRDLRRNARPVVLHLDDPVAVLFEHLDADLAAIRRHCIGG